MTAISDRTAKTARDLATSMPDWWGANAVAQLLGDDCGVNALIMDAAPAEIYTEGPSSAHILSYVTHGEARHRQWHNGRLIHDGPLPDRSINIVTAGTIPRAVIQSPVKVLHVYLPHEDLARRATNAGIRRRPGSVEIIDPLFAPDPTLNTLLLLLTETLRDVDAPSRLFIDSLINALTARVLTRWSNITSVEFDQHRGGLAPWQVRRCTEMLQSNVSATISLAELACEVGLSQFHFARAFKESTGLPPHTYQLKLRVERAKALLVETDLAITDVAFAVGYESGQALARLFQREVGVSPSAYRRERRN